MNFTKTVIDEVDFIITNELPIDVMESLTKAVKTHKAGNYKNIRILDNLFDYIAGGACGMVYELGEEYILKVNSFNYTSDTPDGDILFDLQGIPFIPTLYAHSEDNRFIVVQRIKGLTTGEFMMRPYKIDSWDNELFQKVAEEMTDLCINRGWIPNDIHGANCMLDYEGNFWIVDVGLFKRPADLSKPENYITNTRVGLTSEGECITETLEELKEKEKSPMAERYSRIVQSTTPIDWEYIFNSEV